MFDVTSIVEAGGLLLIGFIVYAEVGFLLGFFLPGDTLLIAAGIFAASGHMDLQLLLAVITICAIAGDHTGYWIGHHMGKRLFTKPDSLIFQKEHIERSQRFFTKYGTKTLLVSHFIPVVRTFTPLLAGAGHMDYKKFSIFNAIGDIIWAFGVTLIGYFFGSRIPHIDRYITLVLAGIIVISIIPTAIHILQRYNKKRLQAADSNDKKAN